MRCRANDRFARVREGRVDVVHSRAGSGAPGAGPPAEGARKSDQAVSETGPEVVEAVAHGGPRVAGPHAYRVEERVLHIGEPVPQLAQGVAGGAARVVETVADVETRPDTRGGGAKPPPPKHGSARGDDRNYSRDAEGAEQQAVPA